MNILGTGEPPDRGRNKKNNNGQSWSEIMIEETGDFKFHKINLKDKNASFYDQNVFKYDQLLPRSMGFLEKKFMSNTSLMIKVTNGSVAETRIAGWKTMDINGRQVEVEVKEVTGLNSSEGTIYAPELNATSSTEIIQMSDQIRNIERMTRWDPVLLKRVDTDRYKITFNSRKIPEKLNLGFLRFGVRQFYPLPRGCLVCLRYDHMFRNCPQKDVMSLCRKCGLDVGLDQAESKRLDKRVLRAHTCQVPPRCPNCPQGENEHGSTSPTCQARKKESEIIRMKIDHNLSYGEARKRVNDPSFRSSGQSFATTFASTMTVPTPRQPSEEVLRLREQELTLKLDIADIEELTQSIRDLTEKKRLALMTLEREKEKLKRISEGYRQAEEEEMITGAENFLEFSYERMNSLTNQPMTEPSAIEIDLEEMDTDMTKNTKGLETLESETHKSKMQATSSKSKTNKAPTKKPLKYKELETPRDSSRIKEVTQTEMVAIYAQLTPAERQKVKNIRDTSRKEQKTLYFLQDGEYLYSQWK